MISSFYKNTAFLFGFSIIMISLLLAIFAFAFIPDKSQNANDQIPELALKPPMTKSLLLKQKIKSKETSSLSFILGSANTFRYTPIKSYHIKGNDLIYTDKNKLQKSLDLSNITNSNRESYVKKNLVESRTFIFGTDKFGRDIFSRLILGLRISLFVGFIAVLISVFVGIFIGLISGYYGGWVDQLVMFTINTFWSIPTILLVFAIVVGFGRSITVIFIAVGLTMWVDVARIVRGQVMSQKQKLYVVAAKSTGMNQFKIISKHILPNIISPIFVIAAANFAIAILIEAGLSYLGFGVQPPVPSLGNMLNENYGFALSGKIYMAAIPALTIMILVLAFNLAGNGLRDIFDVKER